MNSRDTRVEKYKRIMIIGRPGSGKTTFSCNLGEETKREVTHLDKYYWKSGWVKAYTSDAWTEKVATFVSEDTWILDGNFTRTIDLRLNRADTIVFFDVSVWRSLYGAYYRWIFGGSNPVDKHPGMRERVSFMLLKMILFYPTRTMRDKLANLKNKDVFVVRNRKEAQVVIDQIAKVLILT